MRIFREAQPPIVVAENVPGLLTIEDGMVFERVCLDLEDEGYEVTPLVIPACATGAPHRRDRVWIVANIVNNTRFGGLSRTNEWEVSGRMGKGNGINPDTESLGQREQVNGFQPFALEWNPRIESGRSDRNASNANGIGLQGQFGQHGEEGQKFQHEQALRCNRTGQEHWLEAATRLCSLDDASARGLDTTTILDKRGRPFRNPRAAKGKWRTESLKAYGNAIVWQVAYQIFKAIEETDKRTRAA